MRVLLSHNQEDRAAYYGRSLPELEALAEVAVNPNKRNFTSGELVEAAMGCQVIVTHRCTPIEGGLFVALPDLLAVFRCVVDISDIDVEAASRSGVLVGRAPKSFIASTAELALGLLIDLSRNISQSTFDYRTGRAPVQRSGIELRSKTAGIIGYGAIGSYLAGLLQAVGMSVLVHDPLVAAPVELAKEFDELVTRSDVVFPLAPALPETEHLIDAQVLQDMKPGALLINVSRGELLDEAAVVAALDSGHLGGLGLDVGSAPDQRPPPSLAARPGVVATPHLGGLTSENADAQAHSSVEQVAALCRGELPPRTVNASSATRLQWFFDETS